jgi:cell division protein FtsB
MDRVRWIAFLLFIYSCQKANIKLEQPIDNQPIIEEIKKTVIPEPIKYKAIQALNNCEDYSKRAYEIVTHNQKQIDSLKAENQKLLNRINDLEDELKPWRMIKGSALLVGILGIVYIAIQIYLKFKPI